MSSKVQENIVSDGQVVFDDMPQMPDTTGFLEIFQQMIGLNLIDGGWVGSLGVWAWIAIIVGILLVIGLLALAGWYYWQNREEINGKVTRGYQTAKDKTVSGWDKMTKWIKRD